MKKTLLLIASFLFCIQANLSAQTYKPTNWKVSLGLGVATSDGGINPAFANSAQVVYTIDALELGIGFSNAIGQTPTTFAVSGKGYVNPGKTPWITVSKAVDSKNDRHSFTSSSAVDLSLGLNFLKLFKKDSHHGLVLGVFGGLGFRSYSYIYSKDKNMDMSLTYGNSFSYGANLSYEYMFTKRIGTGLTLAYDHPQEKFSTLANLIVRF